MSSPKFVPPSARARAVDEPIAPPVESGLVPPPPADSRIHDIAVGRTTRGFNSDGVRRRRRRARRRQCAKRTGRVGRSRGETTIVLIDPAVPGEGGRYARWDFAADGTAGLYRPAQGTAPAGAYFELPWPDAPPAHDRLKLFVRVTTVDGTKLEAEQDSGDRSDGQRCRCTASPGPRASPERRAGRGSRRSPTPIELGTNAGGDGNRRSRPTAGATRARGGADSDRDLRPSRSGRCSSRLPSRSAEHRLRSRARRFSHCPPVDSSDRRDEEECGNFAARRRARPCDSAESSR